MSDAGPDKKRKSQIATVVRGKGERGSCSFYASVSQMLPKMVPPSPHNPTFFSFLAAPPLPSLWTRRKRNNWPLNNNRGERGEQKTLVEQGRHPTKHCTAIEFERGKNVVLQIGIIFQLVEKPCRATVVSPHTRFSIAFFLLLFLLFVLLSPPSEQRDLLVLVLRPPHAPDGDGHGLRPLDGGQGQREE